MINPIVYSVQFACISSKMPDASLFSDGSPAEQYNLDSGREKPVDKFADEIVGVFLEGNEGGEEFNYAPAHACRPEYPGIY